MPLYFYTSTLKAGAIWALQLSITKKQNYLQMIQLLLPNGCNAPNQNCKYTNKVPTTQNIFSTPSMFQNRKINQNVNSYLSQPSKIRYVTSSIDYHMNTANHLKFMLLNYAERDG